MTKIYLDKVTRQKQIYKLALYSVLKVEYCHDMFSITFRNNEGMLIDLDLTFKKGRFEGAYISKPYCEDNYIDNFDNGEVYE